jgi:hypothetical protein
MRELEAGAASGGAAGPTRRNRLSGMGCREHPGHSGTWPLELKGKI